MIHTSLGKFYKSKTVLTLRTWRKVNLIPLTIVAWRDLPLMKRKFTNMEASSSGENSAKAGVSPYVGSSVAAGGPNPMDEMVPPTAIEVNAVVNDPPPSKNKLKKLKRDQEWEENREKRKARRKEKLQEKKQRMRTAREEAAAATGTAIDAGANGNPQEREPEKSKLRNHRHAIQAPITLVIDCGFDDLMMDTERKSLASQLTRCYSDNCKAPYPAHLVISSFGGYLKDRFDTVLSGNHKSWKGIRFLAEGFAEVASQAQEQMKEDNGDKIAGALASQKESLQALPTDPSDEGEIIYLTSDSPNTLTELRPYSTYIIGGIVDKNRHKGICYKKAMDKNMKTAKLPIGDYMKMTSRFVLATNHVVEIMLRWLEVGDWGEAFLQVIPKRKGGVLKGKAVEGDEETGATPSNAGDFSEAAEQHDAADTPAVDMSKEEEDPVNPGSGITPS